MTPHTAARTEAPADRSPRSAVAFALIVLGVVAFVVRGHDRIQHPVLWAEDGTQFFTESITRGADAVITPFAGYLHVLPRLLALILSPFPYAMIPLLYTLAAVLTYLAVAALVLTRRVAWLLPSARARATAFLLLCLLPPLDEAYGNIANLIFVGGIGLFLLAMSNDPASTRGRVLEAIAVGVLATSGPVIVMILPVYLARWLRCGRSRHSSVIGLVAVAAALVQSVVYLASSRSTSGGGTVGILARSVPERVSGAWLFGSDSLFKPGGGPAAAEILATIWIVAALVVTAVVLRRDALGPWVTLITLLAVVTDAYGESFVGNAYNLQRHVMTPLAIVVVLLVAAVARSRRRVAGVVAAVCLVLGAYGIHAGFLLAAHPNPSDMTRLESCRDADELVCVTPISPLGWAVIMHR